MRDGGEQSGPQFEDLQAAVDAALGGLPEDQGVYIVIVFEAAGVPLTDGLVAMEEVHGRINDALQAVADLRNGGPEPLAPDNADETLPPSELETP
jgi:hypothetical protein